MAAEEIVFRRDELCDDGMVSIDDAASWSMVGYAGEASVAEGQCRMTVSDGQFTAPGGASCQIEGRQHTVGHDIA